MEVVSFVCSIVLCVVGVATFVGGLTARSKSDGILMQKLDQAVDGIEDLKNDLKEVKDNQHKSDLEIQSHKDQLKTLFRMLESNEKVEQSLVLILDSLKHIIAGGEQHGSTHQ